MGADICIYIICVYKSMHGPSTTTIVNLVVKRRYSIQTYCAAIVFVFYVEICNEAGVEKGISTLLLSACN